MPTDIIIIIFLAVIAVIAAFGALLGVLRRTAKAALRRLMVLLSAVIALPLSGTIASFLDVDRTEAALAELSIQFPELEAVLLDVSSLTASMAALLPFFQLLKSP